MLNRRTLLIGTFATSGLAALPARAEMSGSFEGRSTHTTVGAVRIVEDDGVKYVEFGDDFHHDQSPDPIVALGNNGYDAATRLGPLQSRDGAQRYEIPASLDPADYNEVWLWCGVADVALGMAALN